VSPGGEGPVDARAGRPDAESRRRDAGPAVASDVPRVEFSDGPPEADGLPADATADVSVEASDPAVEGSELDPDDDVDADLDAGDDAGEPDATRSEQGVTPGRLRPMSSTDAGGLQELAARALTGEQGAVADLLTAVRRLVHRYCRAKLGRLPGADHAAEDAAQEVCIAVLTALPRYKDTGRPFEAFVYRIAANKVADAQRASYRSPVPTDDVPDAATAEPGPEQLALDAFDAETVGRLLDTLPPKLREIITLRVGAGMSAEETGRALDMTAGAVRVAQHRAMQKLRKIALEDASLQVAP
jgi:RNA polymerase sigma-70 factor, ECF subfamily